MKYLLAAVNAKYNHMNPAVYLLKACSGQAACETEVAEYTINQYPKDVLIDIFEKQPRVIGFSCYIWNMNFIGRILEDIKKILPETMILLGGPEVSYNPFECLVKYPAVDGIFVGEGENAWRELMAQFEEDDSLYLPENRKNIKSVTGLILKNERNLPGNGENPEYISRLKADKSICPELTDMDSLPFIFGDLAAFENRMLYYETSRGCPFRCSYCLSSIDKKMRFRSLEKVLPELQYFLDNKVKIVKFIDRTFNANHEHAMGIWKYLAEHDNGVTRFHFEIEADILKDDEIEFLKTVRPGQFQFEVGVQSANKETLKAINRYADLEKIKSAVMQLKAAGNIPVHVDLIAGLPYEDLDSFRDSFNEVYGWGADELQLGFLKVLHGTEMERKACEYDLLYESSPAYEVISTKWLSYKDIVHLKEIEEQLERYGNSQAFKYSVKAFADYFSGPFEMFEYIADYYSENKDRFSKQSRISSYEMLRNIIAEKLDMFSIIFGGWDMHRAELKHFDALLLIDLYAKEKLKVRPAFFEDEEKQRSLERQYLKAYNKKSNTHVEFFDFDVHAFIESGDIIDMGEDECAVVFEYEGQGKAKSIAVHNIAQGTLKNLEAFIDYDI